MTDIKLDENFDINLDGLGDIDVVQSVEEAEQHIRYAITRHYWSEIGKRNSTNIKSKLRIEASRIVNELEIIQNVDEIRVEEQEGDFVRMYIRYNYNEEIEFEVI